MHSHLKTGARGEDLAANFLKKQNYQIHHRNWQYEKLEVDLVAEKDNKLIFVEVKTRQNNHFGYPENAVSKAKQRHLIEAAEAYLEAFDLERAVRFDIISITLSRQEPEIYHIVDAINPFDVS